MAAKRSSLFGGTPSKPAAAPLAGSPIDEVRPSADAPAPTSAAPPVDPPSTPRYPKAKTREGKRVATVYLDREALRQLQKVAFDEETTIQALLVEGINAVFERRGLSRIA